MKKYLFFISIIITCLTIYLSFNYSSEKEINSSSIYKITNEYLSTGKIIDNNFILNENEKIFIEGLKSYNNSDFKNAKFYFQKSKEIKNNNPLILFYSNFYLNKCELEEIDSGNFTYITNALDIMKDYSILSNNTNLIWQMISSVASDIDSRKKIISLLENYLKNTKNLKLENALKLKGFIAMMKMSNEEYGESIYLYYEILAESEKIKNPEIRSKIQIKSYEYLGNMYFILEDYKSAIKYYDLSISIPIKNNDENALTKYGAHINRSESYILLNNYEEAINSSFETEKIIPYLPENIATGVKIFRYKNLMLLESKRSNFKKAEEYYNLCTTLLKKDSGNAFINAEMYVELAHSEMLFYKKDYSQAIKNLNLLLEKDLKENWGFDTSIYHLLLKIYKETDELEKHFNTGKKLYYSEKRFNENLKKDYIEFVKNSYTLEQLKIQEKISKIKIIILGTLTFLSLISIILGIKKIKNLHNKNFTDALTNIYNRKYLDYLITTPLKEPLSAVIVMIDIDFFKNYNDFYGHLKGDEVIKNVADILKKSIRKNDALIRYGGEEFLIILKNANIDVFKEVYNRISKNLYDKNITHEKSTVSDRITLSVGVTFEYFEKSLNLKNGIKKADDALYISKRNGRNRFTSL